MTQMPLRSQEVCPSLISHAHAGVGILTRVSIFLNLLYHIFFELYTLDFIISWLLNFKLPHGCCFFCHGHFSFILP